jgi:hydrogenase nickel incorporation protein HypB
MSDTDTGTRTVEVHQTILAKNDALAARNRALFRQHRLFVLNLLSSPGSGKTALLERTLADLNGKLRMGVIVGDLATDNDARRLSGKGAPVLQITTGDVCHLDAEMVASALEKLDLAALDALFIENVGNLVCPASYDLGEDLRVALLSVTEGEDKPLKYPTVFKGADAIVVTKIDIVEAVGFDREAAMANLRRIAPQAAIFELAARTGQGMEAWYAFLQERVAARRGKENGRYERK